jgi:hypothetical protein
MFSTCIPATKKYVPRSLSQVFLLNNLFFFIIAVDFFYVWLSVLFKICIQICNIINCVWILFNNKINHNKIYNIFNKSNNQTFFKKINDANKKIIEELLTFDRGIAPVHYDVVHQKLQRWATISSIISNLSLRF